MLVLVSVCDQCQSLVSLLLLSVSVSLLLLLLRLRLSLLVDVICIGDGVVCSLERCRLSFRCCGVSLLLSELDVSVMVALSLVVDNGFKRCRTVVGDGVGCCLERD